MAILLLSTPLKINFSPGVNVPLELYAVIIPVVVPNLKCAVEPLDLPLIKVGTVKVTAWFTVISVYG